jgi:hypothetical protein
VYDCVTALGRTVVSSQTAIALSTTIEKFRRSQV